MDDCSIRDLSLKILSFRSNEPLSKAHDIQFDSVVRKVTNRNLSHDQIVDAWKKVRQETFVLLSGLLKARQSKL